MQDALRNVPDIACGSDDGQRAHAVIRGFSAISDQFVNRAHDDALYLRDLADVSRIEAIKAPASALYGRVSSGGLIDRVTRKPGVEACLRRGFGRLRQLRFPADDR